MTCGVPLYRNEITYLLFGFIYAPSYVTSNGYCLGVSVLFFNCYKFQFDTVVICYTLFKHLNVCGWIAFM